MLHKPRSLVRSGGLYCPCGCTGTQPSRTLRTREKARWRQEVRRG